MHLAMFINNLCGPPFPRSVRETGSFVVLVCDSLGLLSKIRSSPLADALVLYFLIAEDVISLSIQLTLSYLCRASLYNPQHLLNLGVVFPFPRIICFIKAVIFVLTSAKYDQE